MSQSSQLFRSLLDRCIETRASDLHLSAEMRPFARIHGQLQPIGDESLSVETMEEIAVAIMNDKQRKVFAAEQTLDMAVSSDSGTMFRLNAFRARGNVSLTLRRLDDEFRTLEQLHLPASLAELADLQHGLVLVCGSTGSGKSTTLATLIHLINCQQACHIITVEDPLEYIHKNIQSVVRQRELYTDVPTFAAAVRAALREDPDVILVGEMRDLETMRAAITAAETGHLVFSTLHSGDAVGAIDRMVGVFPADEQESIRHQLSGVLRAVVAQRLIRERHGTRRVPCVEILRINTAVANLIRRGELQFIHTVMETGAADGMRQQDQSLADLVAQDLIDVELARDLAKDENVFEARLKISLTEIEEFRAAEESAKQASSPKRGFWAFSKRGE